MVVMALIAFTCVLCIGFDVIYDRLGTLRDPIAAAGSRPQILKDIAAAWTKFPMLGTGLGTHAVVYPMFDRSTVTLLAAHAENEYAQALEETGLIGLTTLVIFGVIIWSSYPKNIRRDRLAVCSAAYGLGFGIFAILVHSFSDFGQHLPANSILSAVFCALMLALAQQGHGRRRAVAIGAPLGRFVCTVVLLSVSGIWVWSYLGANNARVAEGHWSKALAVERELISNDWQGTGAEYADLISHASAAADYEPENVKYQHWLNVYRWRSLSQAIDASAGDIVVPEHLTPSIRDIVDEFHKARSLCPTYGLTYCVVGQIEKFVLGDDSGAERIRKSYRLAPCNPRVCFLAGYTDVLEGKYEDCVEKFERAAQLDDRFFANVVGIYVDYLSRPHLAIAAAGNDIGRLSHAASILEDFQYSDLAEQAREKMEDLLEGQCRQSDAPASAIVYLATICRKRQDNEAAIECYRRALALDYGQVGWRLELARLLVETGRIREAMREARICLQLRPQSEQAKRLVADLSVHPLVMRGDDSASARFE
jgi:tetratricopeptide (TPR) repeat protein